MMHRPRILLVEDTPLIIETISVHLFQADMDVIVAENGAAAIQQLDQQPALILIATVLADQPGQQLCRTIRTGVGVLAQHADLPIILLGGHANEAARLAGFQAGADDYITTPFSPQELVLRIAAILRRCYGIGRIQIDIGPLHLDPQLRQVRIDDQPVNLTPKEFDLLHLLASSPGQVFSREYLLQHVWDYQCTVDTRTVDVHINRLRQKLDTRHACGALIDTQWGVGYRLAAAAGEWGARA